MPVTPRTSSARVGAPWSSLYAVEGLSPEASRALLGAGEPCVLEADAPLFSRGDPPDALYLVAAGHLQAEGSGIRLGRGQIAGEVELVTGEPRRAGVRATREAALLRVSAARFAELVRESPGVALEIARLALRPPAQAAHLRRDEPAVIAAVGLGEGAPVARFCDLLLEALADLGSARRLRAADGRTQAGALEAPLGSDPHAALAGWLQDQERGCDALLLEADAADTPWSRLCYRQADTALLVAWGEGPIPDTAAAARFREPSRLGASDRRELVLVWPDGAARPRGARRWLDAFPVAAHHHVRLGRPDDLARVARRARGMGVTLALSGGAARGLAHVGVIRALRALGVPIDHVCGTSMGSLFGAMVADQRGIDAIEEAAGAFLSRWFLDPTVPLVSALSGARLEGFLRDQFGDLGVEDLWLPYFSAATSLTRCEPVALRAGRVADAVRASSSVPGLYAPVPRGGDILVDGLFLENLPAARARQEVGGYTVAVNVMPAADRSLWAPMERAAPGWRRAVGLLRSAAAVRAPPVADLILYCFFMPTVHDAARVREQADVFIEPAVGHIHFLDGGAREEAARLGEEAAERAIRAWWARDSRAAALGGRPRGR